MPRSVICSPSHMRKMVPAVSVMMVMSRKLQPGMMTTGAPVGLAMLSKTNGDAKALDKRDQHGAVAGVLGDLLASGRPIFLLHLGQLRTDNGQELDDDGGRDIGHDAQGEDGEVAQPSAGKHVEKTKQRVFSAFEKVRQKAAESTPGTGTCTPMR